MKDWSFWSFCLVVSLCLWLTYIFVCFRFSSTFFSWDKELPPQSVNLVHYNLEQISFIILPDPPELIYPLGVCSKFSMTFWHKSMEVDFSQMHRRARLAMEQLHLTTHVWVRFDLKFGIFESPWFIESPLRERKLNASQSYCFSLNSFLKISIYSIEFGGTFLIWSTDPRANI